MDGFAGSHGRLNPKETHYSTGMKSVVCQCRTGCRVCEPGAVPPNQPVHRKRGREGKVCVCNFLSLFSVTECWMFFYVWAKQRVLHLPLHTANIGRRPHFFCQTECKATGHDFPKVCHQGHNAFNTTRQNKKWKRWQTCSLLPVNIHDGEIAGFSEWTSKYVRV